ncbi:unnamed protein product [Lymnaea stagnalis]|uniref:RING-type domain-containing protein n=1 Tax=Lymnaea stagnalis TaxID=6523 RepID=A0AAV2HB83_LYMST
MDSTTEHELMEVDIIEELEFMEVDSCEDLGTSCRVCLKTFEYSQFTWCPSSHNICLLCLKTVIRDFMDKKEAVHFICPVGTCRETIHIDLLTREVDTLTYELLRKKFLKRQRKANEELAACLFQKIR